MANQFNTKEALANKILLQMEANTVFMMNSNRDYQEDMVRWVTDTEAKVEIRLPNNFEVNDTWDITSVAREVVENFDTLTADRVRNVSFDLSTFEDTFEVDKMQPERTTDEMPSNLALRVDRELALDLFYGSYYNIGTPGATLDSWKTISKATAFMNKLAVPDGGNRIGILSEDTYANLGADPNLQNSNALDINKDITRKWRIGTLANVRLYHNHAVVEHIAGVGLDTATPSGGYVAAGTVKTEVTSGTTMTVEGLTASSTGVFVKGDKIDLVGRSFLHPRDLYNTGKVFQVTVQDVSVDADGSGEAVVNFLPAIVTDGPKANIDSAVAVGTVLQLRTANTGVGSATKVPAVANVFYHPTALMFAAPKVKRLFKDDIYTNSEDGINIRIASDGDILKSIRTSRLDLFYGDLIRGERSMIFWG